MQSYVKLFSIWIFIYFDIYQIFQPDDLFTCSNELWQNSDPSVAGEADGLEDFGPIVSASTTPNLPETHGNSITTSNENEKSEILESAHINDLASLCEPSASGFLKFLLVGILCTFLFIGTFGSNLSLMKFLVNVNFSFS